MAADRVDDSGDAQRAEQARQAKQASEKKTDAERLQAGKKFAQSLEEKHQGNAQMMKRGADAKSSRNAAMRRQGDTKAGEVSQQFSSLLNKTGGQSQGQKRTEGKERDEYQIKDRTTERSSQETKKTEAKEEERAQKQIDNQSDKLAAIHEDDRRGGSGGEGADSKDSGGFGKGDQKASQGLEGVGGQQAQAPVMEGTKEAQASRAPKEVIQELSAQIVQNWRQGFDPKKNIGTVQIELNQGTLKGAELMISGNKDGISVKFGTQDPEIERLLSSGSTAHELSSLLKGKGIRLQSLEVNDQKVIR